MAVFLLLPLLLSLGFWQLHRGTAKQRLLDQFALRSQQLPQPLANDEPIYTPVQATGSYDNAHLILLDNRIVNHQVGYDVLVPFIPLHSQKAVLVNMGWISRQMMKNGSFQQGLESNPISIVGLAEPPSHNLVLAEPKTDLHWPLLIENIRTEELSRVLDRPLYSFILLLNDKGFTHHWGIGVSVTPERHLGYAVQWFALALTLIFLYVRLNIHRNRHE